MGERRSVALGLRLFAIWLVIDAVQLLALYLPLEGVVPISPVPAVILGGATVIAAIVVWAFSSALSKRLMPDLADVPEPKPGTKQWLAIGCVLMGLFWVKTATISLIVSVTQFAYFSHKAEANWIGTLTSAGSFRAFAHLLELMAGLVLVCAPRAVTDWLIRRMPLD